MPFGKEFEKKPSRGREGVFHLIFYSGSDGVCVCVLSLDYRQLVLSYRHATFSSINTNMRLRVHTLTCTDSLDHLMLQTTPDT